MTTYSNPSPKLLQRARGLLAQAYERADLTCPAADVRSGNRIDWVRENVALDAILAALTPDAAHWKPITEFDMARTGPSSSVVVAVTCEGREPVIGEAYFDPDAYDGTWWWAGTSHGEYHDSPIEEMQHGRVTHFQPMPVFP